MKVLHVCNHFWPSKGGIEKFVQDLCLQSQKRGIETDVLCLNRPHHSKKKLLPKEVWNGISITRVPFLDFKYYKFAWLPLQKIKEADLVQVHGIGGLLDFVVLTKRFHRKPIIVSTHGGIFHTPQIKGIKKWYFEQWTRRMLKTVDLVVACSKPDLALFKPIARRVVLIENGVELERLKKCVNQKKVENRFLFVGRLSKNKGIEQLLQAFKILEEQGIDFELRLVGEDWDGIRSSLERLSTELGLKKRVVFVGEIDENALIQEYGSARFFVSASQYEGFGISAIEAMAAGAIPILNDIPTFRAFVTESKCGKIVQFSTPSLAGKDLVKYIKQENDCNSGIPFAFDFDWSRKMQEWMKVYDRVSRKS